VSQNNRAIRPVSRLSVAKLNAKKIKGMRKEIIAGLEEDFLEASDEEIKEEIVSLAQKEENRFKEMCFVSVSYLRNTMLEELEIVLL
jgi:putative heme iron utilization protein